MESSSFEMGEATLAETSLESAEDHCSCSSEANIVARCSWNLPNTATLE